MSGHTPPDTVQDMSPRKLPLVVALLLGTGRLARGQTTTEWPVTYALDLVDISVRPTSSAGLQILVAPSVNSLQGADSLRYVWLTLHPDSVMTWLSLASIAITSPVTPNSPKGIRWARPVETIDRRGTMTLGRDVSRSKLGWARWLVATDERESFRFELDGAQADSLIQLLFNAAALSGYRPPPELVGGDTAAEEETPDEPVVPIRQSMRGVPDVRGRVLLRYVVEADGTVDPAAAEILLATDPRLIEQARGMLRRAEFRPARLRGRPVRQVVQEAWVFR